jgi:hypothetical protein
MPQKRVLRVSGDTLAGPWRVDDAGERSVTFVNLGCVDKFDQDDALPEKKTQVELVPAHPGYDLLVAFDERSGVEFTRTTIVAWALSRSEGTYDFYFKHSRETEIFPFVNISPHPVCLDSSILMRMRNSLQGGLKYIKAIRRPDGKIETLDIAHEGRDSLIEYDEFLRFCDEKFSGLYQSDWRKGPA